MKKIMALVLSIVCIMSSFMIASADTSHLSSVTYTVEYTTGEDGAKRATVYFEAGSISAFDFGVIYDPTKVALEEVGWTEKFFEIKQDSETYTVMNIYNPTAVDNVGKNTYAVFTGTAMYNDEGDSVYFGEEPIAYATFTGIDEGDELAMVLGTATVDDVRNATVLGSVDLYDEIEIGTNSYLLEGAEAKKPTEAEKKEKSQKIVIIVICSVFVIVAVVLVIVSKKNKLDGASNTDEDDDYDDDEDDEE